MLLPPATGYYVTDRVDVPPPLPQRGGLPTGPGAPPPAGPFPYEEWHESGAGKVGKIVNRPNNKDKFKPSPSYVSDVVDGR